MQPLDFGFSHLHDSAKLTWCPVKVLHARLAAKSLLTKARYKAQALMQVNWITFHSGYDFGYLLKILTCQPLPAQEAEFFEILKVGDLNKGKLCHERSRSFKLKFQDSMVFVAV